MKPSTVNVTVANARKRGFLEYRTRHSQACLSRRFDHLIAILVNQGSDPTVPYQALVIGESSMLLEGFAPWVRKALSAREPRAVEVYSADCTAPISRLANTISKLSPTN